MKLIDLSHTIEMGMMLFSEDAPQPAISPWLSHAQATVSGNYEDCSCEISQVQFLTSIGTYMDSPYHFFPDEPSIEHLELEQLVLPGVVIDCTQYGEQQPIGPTVLESIDVTGKAVLFYTGWDRYWGQPTYRRYPYLTGDTAVALHDQGAKLVGVDCLVIDDTRNPRRPVHVTLLKEHILIIENLTNLGALPPDGFVFHAAPVKVAGVAAFPVRAYGVSNA